MKTVLLFVLVGILFAGCQTNARVTNEPVPSAEISSTVSVTVLLPSSTTEQARQPTVTLIGTSVTTKVFSPTITLTPSTTLVPSPTQTPTNLPPTPTPTLPPTTSVDLVGTVTATSTSRIYNTYPSPDGRWLVQVIIYECVGTNALNTRAYEELRLVRLDTRTEQVIDSQLLRCAGVGAYGLDGLFWSANSRYFYYTDAREGVPDGCGYWERPIICFDTVNGQTERLPGGPLAPDGTKIAMWQNQELIIWELDQGIIARTSAAMPDNQLGPIAWSPDNKALVYLQQTAFCSPNNKSYIVRLDLSTLTSLVLFESETPGFTGIYWDEPGQVRLLGTQDREWVYHFDTNKLEVVR